jgi:hypothetical protein
MKKIIMLALICISFSSVARLGISQTCIDRIMNTVDNQYNGGGYCTSNDHQDCFYVQNLGCRLTSISKFNEKTQGRSLTVECGLTEVDWSEVVQYNIDQKTTKNEFCKIDISIYL